MAQRLSQTKKNQRENAKNSPLVFTAFVFVLLFLAIFMFLNEAFFKIDGLPTISHMMAHYGLVSKPVIAAEGEAAVHFVDVGQGDCSIIMTDDCTVLIDCGEEIYARSVISYIRAHNRRKLDYVIVTHPHNDHMGGMHEILSAFDIGMLIMPEIPEEMIPTTLSFEKMLNVIDKKEIPASYASVGQELELGTGTTLKLLSPVHNDYVGLNDFSIVCKLTHGERSFLFTGDAERAAESDILNSGADISADVIKIAHHGSSSSSTRAFLKRVAPRYAVISAGRDNSYGHPTRAVLDRLLELNSNVLVTMDYGNIVVISDGKTLKIIKESEQTAEKESNTAA